MADSQQASVHTMLEHTRTDEKETAFERTERLDHRCALCSQGPCRITEKAMRNFLLQNTMGTATYHAVAVMKTLRVAEPGAVFQESM